MAAYLQRLRAPGAIRCLLLDGASTKQKIVIDYSSPNIAKQFHIGNLRSTLIGRYIDKVHRAIGHEVTSVNYLGDWGTQFAMIASYWSQMRPSEQFWKSLSDVEKIKSLTDCYVVANRKAAGEEEFRAVVRDTYVAMESALVRNDASSPTIQLWQDISTISQRHLREFYDLLDIQFNHWLFESANVQRANEEVDKLIENGIAKRTSDGLWIVDFEKDNTNEFGIVRKSDTTTLYLSRELAAILTRDEMFQADRYLYVVDRAQRKHFTALKILLDKIGRSDLAAKVEHVPYGRVKGLSTRLGRTEAVGDIITNGTELAMDFMNQSKTIKLVDEEKQKVAECLAVSTVIFNDLKRARNSEYEFSFNSAFSLNQNNALLLQIKHSRLCAIEARNEELLPELANCNIVPEDTAEVVELVHLLNNIEKIIMGSAEKLEACQLTVYLVQLATCVGKVAAQLKVHGQPKEVAVPRLLLLSASRNALGEGMRLLGIHPVESM